MYKIRWGYSHPKLCRFQRPAGQASPVNAILENLPAVLQCLSGINNSMAVGLHAKLSRFSIVYLLIMFKTFLSVTENLHKYLQSETIDLAKAAEYKRAVCDTLKQMHTDDTVRTICAANQIPEHTLLLGKGRSRSAWRFM